MYCRNCREYIHSNQSSCPRCGVRRGSGQRYCPRCGRSTHSVDVVCDHCGTRLRSSGSHHHHHHHYHERSSDYYDNHSHSRKRNSLNGHDPSMMAVLCFFLGGIGIHNFVMGETKKGLLKIFLVMLCGTSFILGLIDFIRILSGTYEVDPDKFI